MQDSHSDGLTQELNSVAVGNCDAVDGGVEGQELGAIKPMQDSGDESQVGGSCGFGFCAEGVLTNASILREG
jgi:hypothetical protein